MKKCLLIQPGAFGDIFLCAPIAKIYHDNGYEVHWPITKKFLKLLERFDYVKPVIISDEILDVDWLRSDVMKCINYLETQNFDVILNLADRGPHSMAEIPGENFELCKYRLSGIPIEYKHTLIWNRNIKKEEELYNMVVKEKEYILVHLNSSNGVRPSLPSGLQYPIVEIEEISGFEIFDWYKVIINAKEIYCVESSVHQFMDGIIPDIDMIPKFILSRKQDASSHRDTYSPYWSNTYLK